MTLLERLKELAKLCERMDGESVGVWTDRWHEENVYVRKEALPILLELAEAVKSYIEGDGSQTVHLYGEMEAVLAKMGGEA